MRTARLIAVLALCAAPLACARREPAFEGAVLPLVERLDQAELELDAARPLDQRVEEVEWVRDGLASVVVRLDGADAVGGAQGPRALWRWPLPLSAATPRAAAHVPELLDLGVPRLEQGSAAKGDAKTGWWIEDGRLALLGRADKPVPESLRVRYVVHAARLFGTEHDDDLSAREACGLRAQVGDRSCEAIALPTGSVLRLSLPPVPDGRLELALRALPADPERGHVEVQVRVGGRELFAGEIPGEADAVRPGGDGFLPLAASPATREIELVARGAPGGLLLVEAPLWSRPRSWADGPNVLLIVADGLRADRVGVVGDSPGVTPGLDGLALDAVRFLDAWSTSSWCLPSLSSILTSTYPSEHQATRVDRRLGRGVTTLAEVFRAAGHRTAAITDGGFAAPDFGVDRGFTTFDASARDAGAVVERARAFLRASGDRPWMLLVHTRACTGPYTPPADVDAEIRRRHARSLGERSADPADYAAQAEQGRRPPEDLVQAMRELYDAEVRATDAALAALLADVRARGDYADLTVVAVTAGHGEELGEHGFLGHGTSLYPEVLRVPLLLKLPRLERASVAVREPVSLLDLAPTLVQAAELGPRLRDTTFGGHPLLSGREPSLVHAMLEQADGETLALLRREEQVLIQGRHPFAELRRAPATQLFDLRSDPRAHANLAAQQRGPAQLIAHRLQQMPEHFPPRTEEIGAAAGAARRAELGAR